MVRARTWQHSPRTAGVVSLHSRTPVFPLNNTRKLRPTTARARSFGKWGHCALLLRVFRLASLSGRVCWLLKHARAVVDEDEEAASSNRASYEARHTPRAAAVARTARGDCPHPGSDSAAQRRPSAIRLAVLRLVRETAPKGARMFTANDMTPTCKAQSSQLAPSLAARHLQ